MKTNMKDIDKFIKETLSHEESMFYDALGEQGVFVKIRGLFKGKNSWLLVIMNIINLLVFGLLIYCIIHAFKVEETNALLLWIAGVFICIIMICMIKIFSWMEMTKNSEVREIKRLELLVSSLSRKIAK
ncbi:MAG: hypothetical protein HKN40_10415 [Winogradskyella sp.]|uniref:DUF6768 family protein n=1 Tax=Winogradskyella sp. TaxID=1883156 RepID=UPI00185C35E5|nr:hypothetical protein [Winogradskyella sp.]